MSSWWVGLDRKALNAEAVKREAEWRRKKATYLDHVGAAISRESWANEHKPLNLRGPIK